MTQQEKRKFISILKKWGEYEFFINDIKEYDSSYYSSFKEAQKLKHKGFLDRYSKMTIAWWYQPHGKTYSMSERNRFRRELLEYE